MLMQRRSRNRRGVAMVEAAVVLPLTIALTFGTIVAGLGAHRYNEIAYLTRLGARWASVRGPQYQTEFNTSAPTAGDVMANVIQPRLSAFKPQDLTPTLTWNTGQTPPTVSFRLSYTWTPEFSFTRLLGGGVPAPVAMTSTSTQVITY